MGATGPYSTPKVSWVSGDGIAYTDLNRIEKNTEFLGDNMEAAFALASDALSYDTAVDTNLHTILTAIGGVPSASVIKGLHLYIRKASGPVYDYSHVAISPGITRSDSEDYNSMFLTSVFTKDITANWASGTGNGGFPSGLTIAGDTEYKVFLIKNSSTGDIDAGFDTSATATNLLADATSYDKYIQLGTVVTNAAGTEIRFSQDSEKNSNTRNKIRSCFPLEVVGYSTSLEITAESVHDHRAGMVKVTLPAHGSGLTSNTSTLVYDAITGCKPDWITGTDEDSSHPAVFMNGGTGTMILPGLLELDASLTRFIAHVQDTGTNLISSSSFYMAGDKGLDIAQTFVFHTWEND